MRNASWLVGCVGLLIVALAVACFAGDTQARVTPPNDAGKMHLSVIGDPSTVEYRRLLAMFERDEDLATLKRSVHFHAVEAVQSNAIYKERYQPNIHGIPTVRLQAHNGVVMYEAWEDKIPNTPGALKTAIDKSTNQLFDPPLLPWRRKMQQNCDNGGGCGPEGCPRGDVITPEDLMDDDFAPFPEEEIFAEPVDQGMPVWLCVVLALVSAGGGFAGAVIGSVKKEMAA